MYGVYSTSIHTHMEETHKGGKQSLNTSPAEGFPFKEISGNIDREGLNCKAWLCTADYNPLTAHTPTEGKGSWCKGRWWGWKEKWKRWRQGGTEHIGGQRDRLLFRGNCWMGKGRADCIGEDTIVIEYLLSHKAEYHSLCYMSQSYVVVSFNSKFLISCFSK